MSDLKIAVITANISGVDAIQGIPKQTVPFDYYYYDENNLPFPLTNLSNRNKARYIKMQTHRFLPQYDIFCWIDGRVHIEGGNFVQMFLEQVKDYDMAIYKHYQRDNVYEEMEYIDHHMKQGSQYLLTRYGNQQLVREVMFYKDQGLPKDYPLYMSGMFARWNNKKVNIIFDEWWKRTIEFSYSDQTMLSCVAHEHDLKINGLFWDKDRTFKLFTIGKHETPNI